MILSSCEIIILFFDVKDPACLLFPRESACGVIDSEVVVRELIMTRENACERACVRVFFLGKYLADNDYA